MPDDLYRSDIVTWSQLQADRLRRHVAGERVNDLDWPHVIEEIEDLGSSEISAVTSLLTQAIIHALKIALSPDDQAVPHWTAEAATFLEQAQSRYRPSMAARIPLDRCFARARKVVLVTAPSGSHALLPAAAPLALDVLMDEDADLAQLIAILGGATSTA